jgi:predicted P-loop ATPase
MNYTEISELYHAYGLTCIPCNGKIPLLHSGYREKITGLMPPFQPDYGTPNGLAVLCGKVSSGFMCIDFDLKNGEGEDFFADYCNLLKEDNPKLYSYLTFSKTISGGYHIYFYADGKPRASEKIAKGSDGKDWIETRGDGGYVIVPPSEGYEFQSCDISALSRLTESEVDYLLSLALCFNEYAPEQLPVYEPKGLAQTGDTPLNRFDNETNLPEWMEAMGYRKIRGNSSQVHFSRPRAKNKNGTDATFYAGSNQVRFWSSSIDTVPDINRNYKPSQLLVFMKYDGDFSKAVKDLVVQYAVPELPKTAVVRPASRVIPDNPAMKLQQTVWIRQLENFVREKVKGGVSLTEELFTEALEKFPDVNPQENRKFIIEYYQDHEDDFDEDNIKGPYLKAEHFLKKNFLIKRNTVLLSSTIVDKKTGLDTPYNQNSIWNMMQKNGIKVNLQQVKSMLDDPTYYTLHDPFVEYFTNLQFKGTGHISKLASYVDTEVTDFWNVIFRKTLIRTIAGAIGEYPNRECIVLCSSEQRIGKTQFIRFLNPWGTKQYYSDEPIVQHKDQMFRICQNLIYLIDEIGQKNINEKMVDFLKMLISKQSVNERRLWENDTTNLNRKVTFWGTTNLPYLYSGQNTRWISIPVKKINPDYDNYITGVKEVDIDSVWAEAYQAYMDGEDFQLSPQEMAFQEKLNQDWICGNEATGLVDTYIRTDEDSSWRSAEEIINSLAISNPNIIRRITGRNLIEALKARNIPHKYEKNAHGYKCHLFNCVVTSEPQKYYESNNPTL